MRCSACGTESPTTARFCAECGARLATTCPTCGQEVGSAAKFCQECGSALGGGQMDGAARQPEIGREARPPAPRSYTPRHLAERILSARADLEGERKQVTVLF